ncbi:MAG: hypothetical protein NTW29_18835 [Bacteroidetes bacterium]|nr:hypothetical protein [Bacteroidota bacterium]
MRNSLFILLLLLNSSSWAQHDFFILKKRTKTIATYHTGSYIAFREKYGPWQAGIIKKIHNDSFYLQSSIVHYYLMGSDTQYLPIARYALRDVMYLPGPGIKIDYKDGEFRVNRGAGHVHFFWVKSGLLFRILGIGYGALNIFNSFVTNTVQFSWGAMGVAAGLYIAGRILKKAWKFERQIGRGYHFRYMRPAG